MKHNTFLDRFDLSGKTAIVTGASKGIGFEIAKGLAEAGASVVLSSRNQSDIEKAARLLADQGYNAAGFECHVGDEQKLKELVAFASDKFGGIDILVHNAATNPVYASIEEMTGELFDKLMQINVKAAYTLSNLAFRYLKKSGSSSIIHISSVEGSKPSPGLSVYSISKAAMIMLAKAQAKEWGQYGIRSNTICPGLVKTKFSAAIWQNEKALQYWENHIPLHRMASPEEMTAVAVFLASPASSYCTGQSFTADGGYLIA
jgi:NAD(P)-dependent dehydrogenase (short-subunit alcohol dehydrogenase family)